MKIIGTTSNGFIVEIEKTDFQCLTGYYYNKKQFSIGEEIRIDALYSQLSKLSTHEKEIKKMAHALKTAAGMLEKIDPVFEQKK